MLLALIGKHGGNITQAVKEMGFRVILSTAN